MVARVTTVSPTCRIADVANPYTYALACMLLMVATIVNSASSFVSGRAERVDLVLHDEGEHRDALQTGEVDDMSQLPW